MLRIQGINFVRHLKDKDSTWDGWKWFENVTQRSGNHLRMRSSKSTDKKRIDPKLVTVCQQFCNLWKRWLKETPVPVRWLVNVDKTPLNSQEQSLLKRRLQTNSKNKADFLLPKFGTLFRRRKIIYALHINHSRNSFRITCYLRGICSNVWDDIACRTC